jgi:acyl-CoA reductase-like NAD-dependent aldehyde dehydrogenase
VPLILSCDTRLTGYWLNPTIITNIPYTSRVQQEEIFGPVVRLHSLSLS